MILIVSLHILVCCFLILVVLLQSGKAGDLASTFGGAGSQTAFGTRSATTLLTKLTAVSAALFMVTCLLLAGLAQRGESSVMEDLPASSPPVEEATEGPADGAAETPAAPADAAEEVPAQPDESETSSPESGGDASPQSN